jgi:hypothetical protein
MKSWKLRTAGWMTGLSLILLAARADAQTSDDAEPPRRYGNGGGVRASAESDPAEFHPDDLAAEASADAGTRDPLFESGVDIDLVEVAVRNRDAFLLTDIALQFAERERVLQRRHASGVAAEDLFRIAAEIAVQEDDQPALKRLRSIAQHQVPELSATLEAAEKLAGSTREGNSGFTVDLETIDAGTLLQLKDLLTAIDEAMLTGDRELLAAVEAHLTEGSELPDAQKASLSQRVEQARQEVLQTKEAAPFMKLLAASRNMDARDLEAGGSEAAGALAQLSGASRGGLFGGSVDPFNRNNVFGRKIETGIRPWNHPDFRESDNSARMWESETPRQQPSLQQRLRVQGYRPYNNVTIDDGGRVIVNGKAVGQAQLKRNPNTGVSAYFYESPGGARVVRQRGSNSTMVRGRQ